MSQGLNQSVSMAIKIFHRSPTTYVVSPTDQSLLVQVAVKNPHQVNFLENYAHKLTPFLKLSRLLASKKSGKVAREAFQFF